MLQRRVRRAIGSDGQAPVLDIGKLKKMSQ